MSKVTAIFKWDQLIKICEFREKYPDVRLWKSIWYDGQFRSTAWSEQTGMYTHLVTAGVLPPEDHQQHQIVSKEILDGVAKFHYDSYKAEAISIRWHLEHYITSEDVEKAGGAIILVQKE